MPKKVDIQVQAQVTRLLQHCLPTDSMFALVTVTPEGGAIKTGVEVAVLSNIVDHRLVSRLLQEMANDISKKGGSGVVVVGDGWDGKIEVDAEESGHEI